MKSLENKKSPTWGPSARVARHRLLPLRFDEDTSQDWVCLGFQGTVGPLAGCAVGFPSGCARDVFPFAVHSVALVGPLVKSE